MSAGMAANPGTGLPLDSPTQKARHRASNRMKTATAAGLRGEFAKEAREPAFGPVVGGAIGICEDRRPDFSLAATPGFRHGFGGSRVRETCLEIFDFRKPYNCNIFETVRIGSRSGGRAGWPTIGCKTEFFEPLLPLAYLEKVSDLQAPRRLKT
jgi:hypothetical protein